MTFSENGTTSVSMGWRLGGGVLIWERSRAPISAMCSVRGIGVALIESTSMLARMDLMRSFCTTPKRCSSSMISRPRSLNCTSLDSMRCVPIMTSTLPSSSFFSAMPLLLGRLKARNDFDRNRPALEAFLEGAVVLLGENRRRHQHGHLLAVGDRLERARAWRLRSCRSRRRRRSGGPSAAGFPCRPSRLRRRASGRACPRRESSLPFRAARACRTRYGWPRTALRWA